MAHYTTSEDNRLGLLTKTGKFELTHYRLVDLIWVSVRVTETRTGMTFYGGQELPLGRLGALVLGHPAVMQARDEDPTPSETTARRNLHDFLAVLSSLLFGPGSTVAGE